MRSLSVRLLFNLFFMMFTSTSGAWAWLHVHWVFGALTIFGLIAWLLWLYKHASKQAFRSVVGWTVGVGIVGILLTASLAAQGSYSMVSMMRGGYGFDEDYDYGDRGMMFMMEGMFEAMEEEWEEVVTEYGEDASVEDMMDAMREEMRESFEEDAKE